MMKIIVSMNLQMNNRSCYSLFLRCFFFSRPSSSIDIQLDVFSFPLPSRSRRQLDSSTEFVMDKRATLLLRECLRRGKIRSFLSFFFFFSVFSSSVCVPMIIAIVIGVSSSSTTTSYLLTVVVSSLFLSVLFCYGYSRRFDWTFFIHI